jgi:hypothetical protein
MAETIKTAKTKAKTASKPKKAAAEKIEAEKPAAKKAVAKKAETGTAEAATEIAIVKPVSQEEVAALAHRFWAERGYQHGQHVADWFRAEQVLRGKAS